MRAIIMGISGQDGSYLAEFLLSRGYEVFGTIRPSAQPQLNRIRHIQDRITLYQADLLDQISLIHLIEDVRPDEIYNLAGPSLPAAGWRHPLLCGETAALGVVRLLEAIRLIDPEIRFFQASSCEMFGENAVPPQTERTAFTPSSPFGAAKLYAHWTTINYRQTHKVNAYCGILFDHESPRRGPEFVTRRITRAAARIKLGLQDSLVLNTLNIHRDWGYAGDYVRAFWMMLQQTSPDDYVIATGRMRSLEDFCRHAFEAADLDWREYVHIKHIPNTTAETRFQGDASHARRKLLWEPEVPFREMIRMMVEADLEQYAPSKRLFSEFAESPSVEEDGL